MKPLPCPWCGSQTECIDVGAGTSMEGRWFRVVCEDERCGAQGPMRRTPVDAAIAWNRVSSAMQKGKKK